LLFTTLHGQEKKLTPAPKESLSFLPQGTRIVKIVDNKIITFLPKNMEIQGILCRGHANDWQTVFYKNGKLELVWLARDQEIQGYPCKKATFWTEIFGSSAGVHFHENGKLKKFKLAKDMTIQGHRFIKGDIIRLDTEGKLVLKK
jgi:hypothetical protein